LSKSLPSSRRLVHDANLESKLGASGLSPSFQTELWIMEQNRAGLALLVGSSDEISPVQLSTVNPGCMGVGIGSFLLDGMLGGVVLS
jgi:hypothetical protein